MRYLRRSSFLRLVVLPFTLTLWLTACTSYVAMQAPLDQSITRERPGTVRVTLEDGSRFKMASPRIEADSLVGTTWEDRDRAYSDTVHVALADVFSVEQEKTDVARTLGGFLALGAAFFLAYGTWLLDSASR